MDLLHHSDTEPVPGIEIAITFDYDSVSAWMGGSTPPSPSALSFGELAPAAVARILPILDKRNIASTFFVPGHTALTFPDSVREIHARGHEVAHHGWVHEILSGVDASTEADLLQRGIDALSDVVGQRPTGYRAPGPVLTPNSVPILIDHDFEYDSSMMGSDFFPYWCRRYQSVGLSGETVFGDATELVEIPFSFHLDDAPHFVFARGGDGTLINAGLSHPEAISQLWIDEFHYLADNYDDGIFTLTFHPAVIGRGSRLAALERVLDIVAERGTFTTCADHAQRWRKLNSAGPNGATQPDSTHRLS